ncbi:histone deacetylase 15 isoform X2 [Impatiens glandulifera]|uniref:histone deacetylase 15 isoform X2 n=1 Tax=Impatiens glandulifera TaxID=253017 RepID=UPI001FB11E9B|nr:histone deacetylase 15 isoform X2 [Impatiens glandulifera]
MSPSTNGAIPCSLHCLEEQSSCQVDNGRSESLENNDMVLQTEAILKKSRKRKEITLEDIYNNQTGLDVDDDDDLDWVPTQKNLDVFKWTCVNCTMVNLDDADCCEICGEHKESGIVRHGFFASPFSLGADLTQAEHDTIKRFRDSCSQTLTSNNTTAIGFDERMLLHSEVELTSHMHPERPDRLRAIVASLSTAGIFPGRCFPIPAREITPEELQKVHSTDLIESVGNTSRYLTSYFTPDTYANKHSACAARLAAGLCADLASAIFSGRMKNGFALVRPPGHHAGVSDAMGFCLHNNAAVAALAARAAGAKKVLIVDWDVHHGNGTQEIFQITKSVLYVSLHRHEGGKFYPGTGAADEVGSMGAEGYCVNVPWRRGGIGDNDYLFAFQEIVLPLVTEFNPDFIIISAGFDAARGDPLGCCDITPAGYAQMTDMLNSFAGGKLLVILEGGYNLRSISSSATSVIKVLLGESAKCEMKDIKPSKSGLLTVMEVLAIQSNFWPSLKWNYSMLQLQWRNTVSQIKQTAGKKCRKGGLKGGTPIWWKVGRKWWLYQVLSGQISSKLKRFKH